VLYSQDLLNAVEISPRKFTLGNIFMGALCVSHRGSDRIGSHAFALVGHSFGGLVIKALVNEARRSSGRAERNSSDGRAISKAKEFLKNLKLVVFYAVPHSGADAETLTAYVKYCSGRAASWLPENMKPFSRKMAKISVMMEDAFYNKKINIYAFLEGQPTL
jgi:triacylglycerol esterase/lipase EstA (alpha/beta hydrolase family)